MILAAGRGQRMRSELPKVLQHIGGMPLLQHILLTIAEIKPLQTLVVVGYKQELVREKLCAQLRDTALPALPGLTWVNQEQQLGTGDAVRSAVAHLAAAADRVLVLNGDVPLIKAATINRLLTNTPATALGLLTAKVVNPYGLGRIIRNPNTQGITAIVEEKDASAAEKMIAEINPGIYVFPKQALLQLLPQLVANNAQQEIYITDVIALAIANGIAVHTEPVENAIEVQGVNTLVELAKLEREYQRMRAEDYMLQGVVIADPQRIDLRAALANDQLIAPGVYIDINVILEGKICIAENVQIGANVWIKDSEVCAGAVILPNSIIDGAKIGAGCQVGPFARIRPGTELQAQAKIGNFVEVKQSTIGVGSKVNHLSYIGDTEIGKQVNVGAGTITCNYDGANKHKTIIGDDVLIGSDTQLIAPVMIGAGTTIAAGTTVTKDVPAGKLLLNKKKNRVIDDWQRPSKQRG